MPYAFGYSGRMLQMSFVQAMKSSRSIVETNGSPSSCRCFLSGALWKRPLLATSTRSVKSRSNGFDADIHEPHAQFPDDPAALTQMISPRGKKHRSSRMVQTSFARDR